MNEPEEIGMTTERREFHIKRVTDHIRKSPELISLLYDLNLLPEQVKDGSEDFRRMVVLAAWHMMKRESERIVPELAKSLIKKLDEIHASQQYLGVWQLAQSHFGKYSGPDYVDELKALREALK